MLFYDTLKLAYRDHRLNDNNWVTKGIRISVVRNGSSVLCLEIIKIIS